MVDLNAARIEPRRTAHEYVKDSLREAILRGDLVGGQRLVQSEIATELRVSTTPVREALRDLATEGLIRLDPHRGAIVHRLSYEEIREVHMLCRLLEPEAVRQAVLACDDAVLDQAADLAAEMDLERDHARWAAMNRRFHGLLLDDLSSPRLVGILRGLRDSTAPYVALAMQVQDDHVERANRDHAELLELYRSRRADDAAELCRRHVDLTLEVLENGKDLLEEHVDEP